MLSPPLTVGATPPEVAKAIAADKRDFESVRKDGEKWAVVGLASAEKGPDEIVRAVDLIEKAILTYPNWRLSGDNYQFPLIEHESLSALYVSKYSRNPIPLSDKDLAEMPRLLDEALADVAHERYAKARALLEKIHERTGNALESVNRDQRIATQVLDACLYDVRIELKTNGRQAAIVRALKCRQDVPDAPPSEDTHPEDVLQALRAAEQTLSLSPKSSLSIDSEPEKGCDVYLSGKFAGKTPYVIRDATQRRYLVQVECEKNQMARVHEIELKGSPVHLVVDTDFESNLYTLDSGIHLTYQRDLPMFLIGRNQQWTKAAAKQLTPLVVRDSPEGLFHDRVLRHIKKLREQLGVTHLVVVWSASAKEVGVNIYGPPRSDGTLAEITNHIVWDGLGEPRKECDAGPERWPWINVMVDQWVSGIGLGVFSWVEEKRHASEREACEKAYASRAQRPQASIPGRSKGSQP